MVKKYWINLFELRNLNQIMETVDSKPYGPSIGSLTGEERPIWYQVCNILNAFCHLLSLFHGH